MPWKKQSNRPSRSNRQPMQKKKKLNNEQAFRPHQEKQQKPVTVKEQVVEVVRKARKLIGLPSIRVALINNYKRKDGPAFR